MDENQFKQDSVVANNFDLKSRILSSLKIIVILNMIGVVIHFLSHGRATVIFIFFDIIMTLIVLGSIFSKKETSAIFIGKSEKKTEKILIIFPVLALIAFIIYYFTENDGLSFIFFMGSATLVALIKSYLTKKEIEKNCKKFANQMGYSYLPQGAMSSLPSIFTYFGDGCTISNIFGTSYLGYPVRLFDFSFTQGSRKNKNLFLFSFYEITIPMQVPDMLVSSRIGLGELIDTLPLESGEQVYLEGNFDSYFIVRVKQGNQIGVRVLLSPDIMAYLIDNVKDFSFLFVGNKIYICTNSLTQAIVEDVLTESYYKKRIEQIEYLISKWLPSLENMYK